LYSASVNQLERRDERPICWNPFAVSIALKILDICQKIPALTMIRKAGVKGSNPFFDFRK